MKIRHKMNWENIASALASLEHGYDKDAVDVLKRELLPRYEIVKGKRAKMRKLVYASRKRVGRKDRFKQLREKQYRESHREQLREYNREYQRKRRAKQKQEKGA